MRKIVKRGYEIVSCFLPKQSESSLTREAKKYWSQSHFSSTKQDLSHWRGKGRWSEENWRSIGKHHFDLFKKLCRAADVSVESVDTMVEWGPGGGSNAVKFAGNVSEFYGVDISQPNLEECSAQLKIVNYGGFVPVVIPAEKPEACIDKINQKVDFFLCTAVFQHFPSKEYGLRILKIARNLLKPCAIALIQIRYDNAQRLYRPKKRDYACNAVTFTSYKIDEFWEICTAAKLAPLFTHLEPDVNYAYYFLKNQP